VAAPDPQRAKSLPLDELSLEILADIVATGEWNEYNYTNLAGQDPRFRGDDRALSALAEGLGWLRNRGLIARSAGKTADAAIFVTRAGHAALRDGLTRVRAETRLQDGLHPIIEHRCRRQFLLGEYEQAVFVAMKSVEVRVRELCGLGDESMGVALMNRAFGPNGPLTDGNAVGGEQEGTRMMFAGAYAMLRNPSGHREVDYDDVAEAAEAVMVASLLMRVLDRVERRKVVAPTGAST
jgi:uncharacterized protein (TIGR02391 family)